MRERYQLHDEFVLYAGNVKPHKNLERLIEAFHLVRRRGLDHLKLVLIGDEISKVRGAPARRAPASAPQIRALPRLPAGRDAGGDVPAGRRLRVPVALRRLRPAAARSDGQRHAGRHVERVVAAGGRRRRRGARRSRTTRRPSPTASTASSPTSAAARPARQGPRAREAVLVGGLGPARPRDLRRGRCRCRWPPQSRSSTTG